MRRWSHSPCRQSSRRRSALARQDREATKHSRVLGVASRNSIEMGSVKQYKCQIYLSPCIEFGYGASLVQALTPARRRVVLRERSATLSLRPPQMAPAALGLLIWPSTYPFTCVILHGHFNALQIRIKRCCRRRPSSRHPSATGAASASRSHREGFRQVLSGGMAWPTG